MRLIAFILAMLLTVPAYAETPKPLIGMVWRSDEGLNDAQTLIKDGKYTEAILALETIIQRNMRNADAHVYLAIAWANAGNVDKAKNAANNALLIDKNHMGAYAVTGLIALKEKDTTQAEYSLNALHMICQNETCPEYQMLKKAIIEAK